MHGEPEELLAQFIAETRARGDGIAWVNLDRMHVTLRFLGDAIEPGWLADLTELLAAIASTTAPFRVCARAAGAFPNLRRPRVIWAGLESAALEQLSLRVEEAACAAGFPRERRIWSPHLTLGRVRDPRLAHAAARAIAAASRREFGSSSISSMQLYRSRLSSAGSVYEVLRTFEFTAPRVH
jgi:2'-5' RNA ligase